VALCASTAKFNALPNQRSVVVRLVLLDRLVRLTLPEIQTSAACSPLSTTNQNLVAPFLNKKKTRGEVGLRVARLQQPIKRVN
jgi:hypothetical protein